MDCQELHPCLPRDRGQPPTALWLRGGGRVSNAVFFVLKTKHLLCTRYVCERNRQEDRTEQVLKGLLLAAGSWLPGPEPGLCWPSQPVPAHGPGLRSSASSRRSLQTLLPRGAPTPPLAGCALGGRAVTAGQRGGRASGSPKCGSSPVMAGTWQLSGQAEDIVGN